MASGAHPQSTLAPPTPPPVQPPAFDQLIESQLRKTRTQVKLVEIVSNTLLLVAGALGFMLVVAWIDHWVFALGFWTRLLALAVLIGGAGWWLAGRILPLIIRRINPVYAAHTIEQAEPSLKNSLINFLLLRKHREEVHAVVYQAVGQRAASDLSHVPAENVVDYSHVLKIGYVLAALLVLGAVYKIVSPKDPFQSAARVAVPWADIDRPSRVEIDDVLPGDVSIFQGDHVDVSAMIRGAGGGDEVHVLFSTIDGQVVDQQLVMQPDEAGVRHVARIPGDDYGAQTSLQYKIIAGDAQTRWHDVEVVPAPHVLVTKVEYTPPRYTRREAFTDTRGDIDALEGTFVTIHARANREVASARLEFDPLPDGITEEAKAASNAESVSIRRIDGQNVEASFYLQLQGDRRSPWHKNYTIRFNTTDGYRNQKPVVHSIDVKPDLAPLAEILSPTKTDVELPLNRKLKIEARAVDPDFALSKLRLVAVSGGRDLLDVALLESAAGHSGQAIKTFEFLPANYDLAVDDQVQYWIVAEDNRTAVKSNTPEPNITRSTPNYRIKIIAPESAEGERSPDDLSVDDGRDEPDDGDASSGGAPREGAGGGNSGGESSEENVENKSEESSGDKGETGNGSGGSQSSSNSPEDAAESSENGEGNSGGSSASQGNDGESRSDSQSGGPSGTSEGVTSGESRGSDGQNADNAGQQGGPRDQPLENDGSRDGDIFDAVNEHRQQQDDLRDGDLSSDNPNGIQGADESFNRDPTGSASENASNANPANSQQNDQSQSGGGTGEQQGNKPNQGGGEQQAGGSAASQNQQGGKSGSKEQNSSGASDEQNSNKQSGGGNSEQNQGGANDQQQNQNAGGGDSEGGQPQGGAKPEGDQNQSGGEGGKQPMGGGMGQNDQSGAGQQTDGGGSPQSQAEDEQQGNKPKSGGGQQGGQKQEQGGKSPGGSKKDSDSQGGSGGDRKGGGEQGGGQSSKQQGQDSAGSSSSGEQGDGAASEPGAGQSGNQGGGDQIAGSPTGRSGEQAGEGSSTGDVDGGERNDDQPRQGDRSSGDPSSTGNRSGGGSPQDASANPQDPSGQRVTESAGDGRGTMPTGGGKPADNHPSDTPLPDHQPGSDKANLEYARKATDLTLDYLKNQKEEPDPELLDKLGWTKDDLSNFIDSWQRMKDSAKGTGETSDESRRLDDSLRSLGLRPPGAKLRTGETGGDRLTNQRDTAERSRPPKEYAEQYRAFSKFITPAAE